MCKVVVLLIQPIAFLMFSLSSLYRGILKSLLFMCCDALFMNQGHSQEISIGMHNFPSPLAPTPTL